LRYSLLPNLCKPAELHEGMSGTREGDPLERPLAAAR
jgi:hypothetical protein